MPLRRVKPPSGKALAATGAAAVESTVSAATAAVVAELENTVGNTEKAKAARVLMEGTAAVASGQEAGRRKIIKAVGIVTVAAAVVCQLDSGMKLHVAWPEPCSATGNRLRRCVHDAERE